MKWCAYARTEHKQNVKVGNVMGNQNNSIPAFYAKCLIFMVPPERLELPTY